MTTRIDTRGDRLAKGERRITGKTETALAIAGAALVATGIAIAESGQESPSLPIEEKVYIQPAGEQVLRDDLSGGAISIESPAISEGRPE